MSFFLGPALRGLFRPKPDDHMELPPPDVGPAVSDPIGALNAAVDLHESVLEIERSSYEARLRGTMDDLFKRMEKRDRNG